MQELGTQLVQAKAPSYLNTSFRPEKRDKDLSELTDYMSLDSLWRDLKLNSFQATKCS